MHVHVWEHIVSLYYRISWYTFTKLGTDKVPLTPHTHLYWLLGQIRSGVDPVWGQNKSQGVPFSKERIFQTGSLQQQNECIAIIKKHLGRSVVFLVSFGSQIFDTRVFDVFLDLVVLVYFNAISIDFYVVKRKRKRSDSVLWQKPLHQQKCQKGKVTTQTTPQKSWITQRLRTDLGRSVGVTTATQLVWLTGLLAHLPTNRNSRLINRTHV